MRLELDKVESSLVAMAMEKQTRLRQEANQIVAQANRLIEEGAAGYRQAVELVMSNRDVQVAPGTTLHVRNGQDGQPAAVEWDDAPPSAPEAPQAQQPAPAMASEPAPAAPPAPAPATAPTPSAAQPAVGRLSANGRVPKAAAK